MSGVTVTIPYTCNVKRMTQADLDRIRDLLAKSRQENASGMPAGIGQALGQVAGAKPIARLEEKSWGFKTLNASPDGKFLAVSTNDEVRIHEFTTGKEVDSKSMKGLEDPKAAAFSPDGQWVLFNRSPSDLNSYDAKDAEVWVVPAAGGRERVEDRHLEEVLLEVGLGLRAALLDDEADLVLADERALDALQLRRADRREEHVAHAEQRLGAVLVEDGAPVGLRPDLVRQARWHVRLDQPGDHPSDQRNLCRL